MSNQPNRPVRTPPAGMPRQAPRPEKNVLYGKAVPTPAAAAQKPVTDEETPVRKPSLIGRIAKRVGLLLLLLLPLVTSF